MPETDELVAVGKIERSFGVRGEARVRSLSDVPGRFEALRQVVIVAPSGKRLETTVTHVRPGGSSWIVGFDAFTAPEQIAEFRGGLVQALRGESPALPSDHYYQCDLIGLAVQNESGTLLGLLDAVVDMPEQQMFVVRQEGEGRAREVLIPASKQVVRSVDTAAGTMTVRLPEGFDEL